MVEWASPFDIPETKPKTKRKRKSTPPPAPMTQPRGELSHVKPGQSMVCDCGKGEVRRESDTYYVKGSVYHSVDGWLVCFNCDDTFSTLPTIIFEDVNAKGQ